MAVIETKFSIGDVVWVGRTTTVQKRHPCPDCLGTREWKAISPAGSEYKFGCPRCNTNYQANHDLSLNYEIFGPRAERLTIGSIKFDSFPGHWNDKDDSGPSYMCNETGVGSGSVYRERELFATEKEALAYSQAKADLQNANPEGWVAKRYNQTLAVSDYQLENALMNDAKRKKSRFESQASSLLYAIDEAECLADVREAKEEFLKELNK